MSSSIIAALARMMSCVALFTPGLSSVTRTSPTVTSDNRQNLAANSLGRRPSSARSKYLPAAEAAPVTARIAFASDRDGNFEIYVMDADGGGQTRLTEDASEDYSPAWSPDGRRLAFVSTRDGNAEIYVMNADGTGQTRLTNNTASDLAPAWTRDGSQIAFVTNRDGNDEIYLMNADGSNQTNLTNNRADDTSFSFSPDGLMIAFASTREDDRFQIFTMNLNGTGVV